MPVITIEPKTILSGESQSDWVSDRGFSPSSYGLNLLKSRGTLFLNAAPVEVGGATATLSGNIIASAYDSTYLGNDAYFADDEGNFYTYNGTTLVKRQTSSYLPVSGTTDFIQFKGLTYCTTTDQIIQLTGSNLDGAFDSAWWTGLTGTVRHPLERVEDSMYIGDANLIHVWNGTTSTASAVTLPTDVNITSLRKHPDGKTLLAFTGLTNNYSHTKGQGGRIYFVDTNTLSWTREIETEVQIEGSRSVGGVVYVSYGSNIGYFNGNGVTSLKKLSYSTTTYSNHMGSFEDIFLVRDGKYILAYGDLGYGKVWWKLAHNVDDTQHISNFIYKGDNKLLFSYPKTADTSGYLYEIDYDSSGQYGQFWSNRYIFPQKARIRKIEIIHEPSNSAGTTAFDLTYYDPGDNGYTLISPSYTNQTTWKTEYSVDLDTDVFQFYLRITNDDIGFRIIRIQYELIN